MRWICWFRNAEGAELFPALTAIKAVSEPKVALCVLSSELTPEQVALAAASGDSKAFTRAAGVGNSLRNGLRWKPADKAGNLRLPSRIWNWVWGGCHGFRFFQCGGSGKRATVLGHMPSEAAAACRQARQQPAG